MKKYIIAILISLLFLSSCNDLDVLPKNMLSESDILSSESGVTAYLAKCYGSMPRESWRNNPFGWIDIWTQSSFTGEMGESEWFTGQSYQGSLINFTFNNTWYFNNIRDCSVFIEKFETYKSKFSDADANQYLGEAYFLRAWNYFIMVKRFGGLPIINHAMSMDMTKEEMQVGRSSEYATYKFICEEFQKAADLLKINPGFGHVSRASKGAALGMLSRAALYAGTISKYNSKWIYYNQSSAGIDGEKLQGIDSKYASYFLKLSCDAAIKCADCGFSLDSYAKIFNNINGARSNKESMFNYEFLEVSGGGGHSFTTCAAPKEIKYESSYDIIAFNNPSFDLVQLYEDVSGGNRGFNSRMYVNGKDASDGYKEYADPAVFFQNKDPRLAQTVLLPFTKYYNHDIIMRKGLRMSDGTEIGSNWSTADYTIANLNKAKADGYVINGFKVGGLKKYDDYFTETKAPIETGSYSDYGGGIGAYEGPGAKQGTGTGFYMRKYTDDTNIPVTTLKQGYNQYPSVQLRYAEVLLNLAEAAIELNDLGDASYVSKGLTAINAVRNRSNLPPYTAAGDGYTIANTRLERQVELALEYHSFYDQRRWRVMGENWNNRVIKALWPFLDYNKNVYYFKEGQNFPSLKYTWIDQYYYYAIPSSQITSNPSILQNYGY